MIAQSLNQIDKIYGHHNSVLDNCHVRISFFSNDERTAKRISDMLGQKTEVKEVVGHSGRKLQVLLPNAFMSTQETARPLLTPGGIMTLAEDKELVLIAGKAPIMCEKVCYYNIDFCP